jgi:xanthine dehydrogenase accessory factor
MTIGLGPGFIAPDNCCAVIETNRSHFLGRVIWEGAAQPNTGIPGNIMGQAKSRVLRAPEDGLVSALVPIGTLVTENQPVARVGKTVVCAPFDGVLRGLVHGGLNVTAGSKIGDVDPRAEPSHCFTISEKALAIGGGVLEAIFSHPSIRERIRQR